MDGDAGLRGAAAADPGLDRHRRAGRAHRGARPAGHGHVGRDVLGRGRGQRGVRAAAARAHRAARSPTGASALPRGARGARRTPDLGVLAVPAGRRPRGRPLLHRGGLRRRRDHRSALRDRDLDIARVGRAAAARGGRRASTGRTWRRSCRWARTCPSSASPRPWRPSSGKPVVAINSATLPHALREHGIDDRASGRGWCCCAITRTGCRRLTPTCGPGTR